MSYFESKGVYPRPRPSPPSRATFPAFTTQWPGMRAPRTSESGDWKVVQVEAPPSKPIKNPNAPGPPNSQIAHPLTHYRTVEGSLEENPRLGGEAGEAGLGM
ncbi:hypothetical protein DFP72DRAFT_1056057 [Ephemerocybe angulata]|uniref:Uncharacterized protein n=1 Tax=Ephemerocybe angulata TaxID=980116 RepID=A0A8H6LSE9_9AGAR|nr:hypothetical protein DFP72DRAFT_1056057 [Tulosesus angulatus]